MYQMLIVDIYANQVRESRLADISVNPDSISALFIFGILSGTISCLDSLMFEKKTQTAFNFLTSGRSVAAEVAISDMLTSRSDQIMIRDFEFSPGLTFTILPIVATQALNRHY
jgi:hypothetical protein